MRNLIKFTLAALIGLFMIAGAQAQDHPKSNEHPAKKEHPSSEEETKPSPAKEATGMIGDANITINYSSPGVKGRTIWGELVPFDKVWRAGANEATTIETDKDLLVAGKELPAGKYSFYVIPREGGPATVIFNKNPDNWGTNGYDEAEDALRVDITPVENDMTERLEYMVNDDGIVMAWENWKLPINVKVK